MPNYHGRLSEFRNKMLEEELKGALVLSRENICYLTGFCVGGYERLTALVVRESDSFLVVPKLSQGQLEGVPVDESITWDDRDDPFEITSKLVGDLPEGKLSIESGTPLSLYLKFRNVLGENPFFVDPIVRGMRRKKRKSEIEAMEKAVRISEDALSETVYEIKPGMTEKEIAGILEYNMRRKGSDGNAFGTTVASGKNSANPHHITSEKKVEKGDSLVIDFGAMYNGYSADTTRTFIIDHVPEGYRDVYETVKKAQETGIEYAMPGMPAGDIDIKVRSVIEQAGYGMYFTHRTGHGIGLETHEEPYINESNRVPLQPPVTFTIEPGIYIQGKYGVRIEDLVLLDEKGARAVNVFTKELTVI